MNQNNNVYKKQVMFFQQVVEIAEIEQYSVNNIRR
jgi:hypothetical protein